MKRKLLVKGSLGTWLNLIRNLALEIGQKEFYKRLQRETIKVNLGNFADSGLKLKNVSYFLVYEINFLIIFQFK